VRECESAAVEGWSWLGIDDGMERGRVFPVIFIVWGGLTSGDSGRDTGVDDCQLLLFSPIQLLTTWV